MDWRAGRSIEISQQLRDSLAGRGQGHVFNRRPDVVLEHFFPDFQVDEDDDVSRRLLPRFRISFGLDISRPFQAGKNLRPDLRVVHDDELKGLEVGRRRRQASGVDEFFQKLTGQLPRAELPDAPAGRRSIRGYSSAFSFSRTVPRVSA